VPFPQAAKLALDGEVGSAKGGAAGLEAEKAALLKKVDMALAYACLRLRRDVMLGRHSRVWGGGLEAEKAALLKKVDTTPT
jgi:hypothetical protein